MMFVGGKDKRLFLPPGYVTCKSRDQEPEIVFSVLRDLAVISDVVVTAVTLGAWAHQPGDKENYKEGETVLSEKLKYQI